MTEKKAEKSPLQKAAEVLDDYLNRGVQDPALLERVLYNAYKYVRDDRPLDTRPYDEPAQQGEKTFKPFMEDAAYYDAHVTPAQQGENSQTEQVPSQYPADATRLSAWAAEERAEQGKTVEQSATHTNTRLHPISPVMEADKQEPGHTVTPAVAQGIFAFIWEPKQDGSNASGLATEFRIEVRACSRQEAREKIHAGFIRNAGVLRACDVPAQHGENNTDANHQPRRTASRYVRSLNEQSREEQTPEKRVEQSNPNVITPDKEASNDAWLISTPNVHAVTRPVEAPVSGSVGAHRPPTCGPGCPLCGWLPPAPVTK